jgi:hypothetical protein
MQGLFALKDWVKYAPLSRGKVLKIFSGAMKQIQEYPDEKRTGKYFINRRKAVTAAVGLNDWHNFLYIVLSPGS